jgi:hypothetical protein
METANHCKVRNAYDSLIARAGSIARRMDICPVAIRGPSIQIFNSHVSILFFKKFLQEKACRLYFSM